MYFLEHISQPGVKVNVWKTISLHVFQQQSAHKCILSKMLVHKNGFIHCSTPSSCHSCIHGSYSLNFYFLQRGNSRKTRLATVSSFTSSHQFLIISHTRVKYFVLHSFMWQQVMIWCLHSCGLLLLHEYFQGFVNWLDFVGKPSSPVCHYATVSSVS
jgi:hypothetical protein